MKAEGPRRRLIRCGLVIAGFAPSCTSSSAICTPENAGLSSKLEVTPRSLQGRAQAAGPCTPGVQVIRSDADLRATYAGFGVSTPPPVDFAKESVILREADATNEIAWTVVQGDVATLGLQGCGGVTGGTCGDSVLAVPAILSRVDTHVCDPVNCKLPTTQ
jgi:hypothetical protein